MNATQIEQRLTDLQAQETTLQAERQRQLDTMGTALLTGAALPSLRAIDDKLAALPAARKKLESDLAQARQAEAEKRLDEMTRALASKRAELATWQKKTAQAREAFTAAEDARRAAQSEVDRLTYALLQHAKTHALPCVEKDPADPHPLEKWQHDAWEIFVTTSEAMALMTNPPQIPLPERIKLTLQNPAIAGDVAEHLRWAVVRLHLLQRAGRAEEATLKIAHRLKRQAISAAFEPTIPNRLARERRLIEANINLHTLDTAAQDL